MNNTEIYCAKSYKANIISGDVLEEHFVVNKKKELWKNPNTSLFSVFCNFFLNCKIDVLFHQVEEGLVFIHI